MIGIVKFFNNAKGFGFITGEDRSKYFFHFSMIEADGFKSLHEGSSVEFVPAKNEKGLMANKVKLI